MKDALETINCIISIFAELLMWGLSVWNATQAATGVGTDRAEHLLWAIFFLIFAIKFQLTVQNILRKKQ